MEGGSLTVTVHIVQRGDTLWKISRQYGVSFDALKRVNGHLANPDYIVPGMSITIPEERGGKAQRPAPKATEPSVRPTEKVVPEEPKSPQREPEKGPIPLPSFPSEQQPPKITTKKPTENAGVKEPIQQKEPVQRPKPPVEVPEQPPHPYQFQPNQIPYIPVQPIQFIPVPCGCMPIYDVDCAPTIPFQSNYPTNHHQLPSNEQTKQPTKPKQPQKEKPVAPSIVTPQLTPNILYTPTIHDDGFGTKEQPSKQKPVAPQQPSQQSVPSAKPQKIPQFTPSKPTTEPYQTTHPQQPIQPSQPIQQPQQPMWPQQPYQPQYGYGGPGSYMPMPQVNAYQNWQMAQFCTSCQQPVYPQRGFCFPTHNWSYGR